MALGMTYEQFWYGDPWMVKTFERAHELRNEMLNQQMWVMGLYITDSIGSVVSTALGKRRDYMKKPIDLHPKTDAEKAREHAVKMFELMRIAWSQKGQADG